MLLSSYTQGQHLQKIVALNVGGHRFLTTPATLAAAKGSCLWNLVTVQQQRSVLPASLSGEIFIDRNGKIFEYVLEHLRTLRFGEPEKSVILPEDQLELAQLAREVGYCLDRSESDVQL